MGLEYFNYWSFFLSYFLQKMVVMMGVHDERSKRRIIAAVANFHGNPHQSSNSSLCILALFLSFSFEKTTFFSCSWVFFTEKQKLFITYILWFWGSLRVMNWNPWDMTLVLSLSCSWLFIEKPKFLITHIQSVFGILYGLWIQKKNENF